MVSLVDHAFTQRFRLLTNCSWRGILDPPFFSTWSDQRRRSPPFLPSLQPSAWPPCPACSPSQAQQSSAYSAGSKEMRRKNGRKRPWTRWWKSWRRRKVPWRTWRKLWAALGSPASVLPFQDHWMADYRFPTGKVCLTLSTAECGVGQTSSPTMSSSPWRCASTRLVPNRRRSASTHITTSEWRVLVGPHEMGSPKVSLHRKGSLRKSFNLYCLKTESHQCFRWIMTNLRQTGPFSNCAHPFTRPVSEPCSW